MKPLIITDCDEVLLRMVVHFRDWLAQDRGIEFDLSKGFQDSMRRMDSRQTVPAEQVWGELDGFFDTEMYRQDAIAGAVDAMNALTDRADVVVLTNLKDFRRDARARQLRALGIDLPVYTNQGPKGGALQRIMAEHGGERPTVFIDDLPQHHGSVAALAPHVTRLHFVGEPEMATHIECAHRAGHAHARIDDWATALPWILNRLEEMTK